MNAWTRTLVVGLLALFVPGACTHHDGSPDVVAVVDGKEIERESVDSLIKLYRSRAEAGEEEGEGETVSHVQEVATLQVLVQRAVLERKAEELGVKVNEEDVEKRTEQLRGPKLEEQGDEGEREEEEGSEREVDEAALEDQFRETARAQLLYEALYRRVTRHVRVARSRVVAYYRTHRSSYTTAPADGREPPPKAEAAIRRGLTATARNQLMARWVARVQSEYASKIDYSEGWSPERPRSP